MQATFLIVLATALNLPQPIPPVTYGLAPGYHLTAHGCITAEQGGAFAAANALQRRRSALAARYNADPESYLLALRNAEHENRSTWNTDLTIRLPFSIVLYRAHRIDEAMAQWRVLLSHLDRGYEVDAGTRAALDGRFHDSLVAYALSPPPFNHTTFGESGAAYNLQRGLNAAARSDLAEARTFLGYALECSDIFQVPHLALGVIAAMDHDLTTARREWLADLEGWDPSPPDTASIVVPQYDALRLLLKFG
jgi:hypothetical protein